MLRCCVGLALAYVVHRTLRETAGLADARRQLPWAGGIGLGRITLAVANDRMGPSAGFEWAAPY